MATITANLNGGDTITPDADLTFKVYGLIDNYTTAIATVGSANTDANVSVNAGVVIIENVDLGLETFVKVTSIDEAGNESNQSTAFEVPDLIATFYVRPAGTTYGTGNGTSYANAWSGFANIVNADVEGNTLAVCGTHTETFYVNFNGTIDFDDANEAGNIDATGLGVGLSINGFDLLLKNPKVNNATVQNLYFENTTSIVADGTANNSENQGVQHWQDSNITYIGAFVSNDNTDEGMSGHLNSIVTINGTFESKNNGQAAINQIEDSVFTINGLVDFSNNVTADIYSTNATTAKSCKCVINSNNTGLVLLSENGAEIEINSGTYAEVAIESNGFITANNVIIQDVSNFSGTLEVLNSYVVLGNYSPAASILFNATNSNIDLSTPPGNITIGSGNTVNIKRCRINGANAFADQLITNESGNLVSIYNEFINIPSNKFAIVVEDTSVSNVIDNNVIDGNEVGRGILVQKDVTINNNVFIDTAIRIFIQLSATLTMNNNLSFNAGSSSTSGGTLVENNALTSNPLFTDSANNDYSLQALSPCIDAGATVSNTSGIDTANFGNLTTVPVIVTKEQIAPFDIGAYVS